MKIYKDWSTYLEKNWKIMEAPLSDLDQFIVLTAIIRISSQISTIFIGDDTYLLVCFASPWSYNQADILKPWTNMQMQNPNTLYLILCKIISGNGNPSYLLPESLITN